MEAHAPPVLYALFLWWFSTGVIAYLDGLPRSSFRWSLLGATALAAAALCALSWSAGEATATGAYVAFTAALVVWGWNETAFLLGVVTGPRPEACPPGCRGWPRLWLALQAILYHELAILASAALVAALTWGGENQVGLWTFLLLWVMRVSAKVNVFLGVRNLNEEFLPDHLRFLASYFRRRRMNGLLPLSAVGIAAATTLLAQAAGAEGAAAFQAAGLTLLATLAGLALLEHALMVLPLPGAALWAWYLGSRLGAAAPAVPAAGSLAQSPITPSHGPNLAPSTPWRQG